MTKIEPLQFSHLEKADMGDILANYLEQIKVKVNELISRENQREASNGECEYILSSGNRCQKPKDHGGFHEWTETLRGEEKGASFTTGGNYPNGLPYATTQIDENTTFHHSVQWCKGHKYTTNTCSITQPLEAQKEVGSQMTRPMCQVHSYMSTAGTPPCTCPPQTSAAGQFSTSSAGPQQDIDTAPKEANAQDKPLEWERRFYEKFGTVNVLRELDLSEILSFIKSNFLHKSELREKVEKLRVVPSTMREHDGWNNALKKILSLLDDTE